MTQKTPAKKLLLTRDTVRSLQVKELAVVAGGGWPTITACGSCSKAGQ
jgi:hypothetical protein